MTFKALALWGLIIGWSIGASASKQLINCERGVRVILFGLSTAQGETFSSGLLEIGSPEAATISSVSRSNEAELSDAFYAGANYSGNKMSLSLPREVVGKKMVQPFLVSAKSSGQTYVVSCVSDVVE